MTCLISVSSFASKRVSPNTLNIPKDPNFMKVEGLTLVVLLFEVNEIVGLFPATKYKTNELGSSVINSFRLNRFIPRHERSVQRQSCSLEQNCVSIPPHPLPFCPIMPLQILEIQSLLTTNYSDVCNVTYGNPIRISKCSDSK